MENENEELFADSQGKTIEEIKEQIKLEEESKKTNTDSTKCDTETITNKSDIELKEEAEKIESMHPSTKPAKDPIGKEIDRQKKLKGVEEDDDEEITDGMCYHYLKCDKRKN